jgi:hypothetical protein
MLLLLLLLLSTVPLILMGMGRSAQASLAGPWQMLAFLPQVEISVK